MPGEHLEAIELAQVDQMPAPRYVGLGVSAKLIHLFAKLCCDEAADGLWNDLTRRQQSARISESTKLKGEAEAIACMATGSNEFEVIVRQCVVVEDGGFVCRQIEQRRALARGQDRASWHAGLSLLVISLFRTKFAPAKSKACKTKI
ncbi:hypothetical protein ACSSVY_004463 [Roseovarius sp. MBR-51]